MQPVAKKDVASGACHKLGDSATAAAIEEVSQSAGYSWYQWCLHSAQV
jgi:hypothetical protein